MGVFEAREAEVSCWAIFIPQGGVWRKVWTRRLSRSWVSSRILENEQEIDNEKGWKLL